MAIYRPAKNSKVWWYEFIFEGQRVREPWRRDGGPLDITNRRERVWRAAIRRAKLRTRTLYQTRHTFATLMLEAGESPGWVAKQLGQGAPGGVGVRGRQRRRREAAAVPRRGLECHRADGAARARAFGLRVAWGHLVHGGFDLGLSIWLSIAEASASWWTSIHAGSSRC